MAAKKSKSLVFAEFLRKNKKIYVYILHPYVREYKLKFQSYSVRFG